MKLSFVYETILSDLWKCINRKSKSTLIAFYNSAGGSAALLIIQSLLKQNILLPACIRYDSHGVIYHK